MTPGGQKRRDRPRAGTAARSADQGTDRRSGRHPQAQRVEVRLTEPAIDDLRMAVRKGDPQVVRWALKKMLLLERDPEAGEGLLGSLIGYRKVVVGNRDWRIVWRVTYDDSGDVIVDMAEVWCFGARSDNEMYAEVNSRVACAPASARTRALADVMDLLGRHAQGVVGAPERGADAGAGTAEQTSGPPGAQRPEEVMPAWLPQVLTSVVGLTVDEVSELTVAQAHERWEAFTRGDTR